MNPEKKSDLILSEDKENVAKRAFDEVQEDGEFIILTYKNESDIEETVERNIDSSFIQFHFCVKGSSAFLFNKGSYSLDLQEENALLLYNPMQDLPIHLKVSPKSSMISVLLSIKKFHGLFSSEANYITFLNDDNKGKKYYKNSVITPSMSMVLNQLINFNLNQSIKNLYFKAKAYELLSLYFNRSEDANIEQCPFLADETNVIKIRKAKDIIMARMVEPPSLQELADEIQLSLKKLKEGFKEIYGDSVFSFLFDYKMEVARKLLESGGNNVNEVGLKVGYSTASHFIAAFKKKYGTTPKKYLMSLSQ